MSSISAAMKFGWVDSAIFTLKSENSDSKAILNRSKLKP